MRTASALLKRTTMSARDTKADIPWRLHILLLMTVAIAVSLLFTCSTSRAAPSDAPAPAMVAYPNGEPATDAAMVFVTVNELTNAVTTDTVKVDHQANVIFPANIQDRPNYTSLAYFKSPTGVGFFGFDQNPHTGNKTVIILHPLTSIKVRLVDSAGAPVPNVTIGPNLFVGNHQMTQSWDKTIRGPWKQTTNADGWATLTDLPQGIDMNLGLVSDRLALRDGNMHLSSDPVNASVTLLAVKAASITGRVLYGGTTRPVAGIQVFTSATMADGDLHRAVTDQNGEFTIAGLTGGSYPISAQEDDSKFNGCTPLPQRVTVGEGSVLTDVKLTILQSGTVSGVVTDKNTGKPVPGVDVVAWASSVSTGYADNTAADGSYSISLVPGNAKIQVMAGAQSDITTKPVNIVSGINLKVNFQIDTKAP